MRRVTGIALIAEAVWFLGGTLVVVPYVRTMSGFEGGPDMTTGEVAIAYVIGFGLAAICAVAGIVLVGARHENSRIARLFVLAAAIANGVLATIAAYTAFGTRGSSQESLFFFIITAAAAALCLYSWWPRSQPLPRT